MKKAFTIQNVMKTKFKTVAVEGKWRAAIGTPQMTGSWMIYGKPKNGKTSFAMMLSKYLAKFGRVAYNSVEEGLSLTMQNAIKRSDMETCGSNWHLVDKDDVETLIERLKKQRSADIVIIDSVQFWGLTMKDYRRLKRTFPDKLFIYISHVRGNEPDGATAMGIRRDANVIFRVEGFRAFPISRCGGDGTAIDVWAEKAQEYWGENQ